MKTLILIAVFFVPYFAYADDPQPQSMQIHIESLQKPLRFIRLAKSDNAIAVVDPSSSHGAYEIPAVYLAETELSLSELRALTSEASWERYKADFLRLLGGKDKLKEAPPPMKKYGDAIVEASPDYPADRIDINLMLEVCSTLNKNARVEAAAWKPSLERVRFRLPTRTEWQYAARAIVEPDQLEEKEHFAFWHDFLPQCVCGKYRGDKHLAKPCLHCKQFVDRQTMKCPSPCEKSSGKTFLTTECEICKTRVSNKLSMDLKLFLETMKDKRAPEQLSQQDLLELADKHCKPSDKTTFTGYQLISDALEHELQKRTKDKIDILQSGLHLLPILTIKANAWGFHRMFGNVAEWTLSQHNFMSANRYWDDLMAATQPLETRNEEFGVIMGGSFRKIKNNERTIKRFSIAHGEFYKKETPWKINQIVATEWEKSKDKRVHGGMRLAVVRGLHPGWFVTFRKDILNAGVPSSREKYGPLFHEILTKQQADRHSKMIDFYARGDSDMVNEIDRDWWHETTSMTHEVVTIFKNTNAKNTLAHEGMGTGNLIPDGFLDDLELPELNEGSLKNKPSQPKAKIETTEKIIAARGDYFDLLLEIDSLHISPEDQEEKDDAGNLIPEGFLDDLELPEL